jgi:SAM-dependent methyltransferase
VPWWLKIAAKLVLGHLPVSYERWRSLGLFRRGGMQDSSYSLRVFEKHLGHAGIGARMNGLTVLELGPGDACASALIARAYGASGCWLVDDAPLATTDIDVYRMLSDHLRKRGLDVPSLSGTSTLAEVAELCHARYLTEGLQSLRSVPDASVDLLWSHSVLEHVKRSELLEVLREMRRIVKPGGVCSHRVDLRDHLSGALNHLRFSEGFWENPFVATSGFYTNRIRFTEMLELFTRAGFAAEVREIDRWSELPTKRSRIAASYRDLSDEELRVWGFHVVLRPAPGSGLG